MVKETPQYQTTSKGNESKQGSNNNLYQDKFETTFSADNIANGMGIAHPSSLKPFEEVPGSEASEQSMLKMREIGRYDELSRKAFGNPDINNAGIVLDSFGGSLGENRNSPKDIRSTSKEQKEN